MDGWAKRHQLKAFTGAIVRVGCGSFGQAVLPLLVRDLGIEPARLTVVTADQRGHALAEEVMARHLRAGDFLLNLSVEVDSLALLRFTNLLGALYLETGIEPWPGGYTDPSLARGERSSQALRTKALALRDKIGPGRPSAVICQGANPGLVSQLVKLDALEMARALADEVEPPTDAPGWTRLFRGLGIRTIQVVEHDSQVTRAPRAADEFVSTWSVEGFLTEGTQPAELGLGTAKAALPTDGRRLTADGPWVICCAPVYTCGCAAGRPRPARSWAI